MFFRFLIRYYYCNYYCYCCYSSSSSYYGRLELTIVPTLTAPHCPPPLSNPRNAGGEHLQCRQGPRRALRSRGVVCEGRSQGQLALRLAGGAWMTVSTCYRILWRVLSTLTPLPILLFVCHYRAIFYTWILYQCRLFCFSFPVILCFFNLITALFFTSALYEYRFSSYNTGKIPPFLLHYCYCCLFYFNRVYYCTINSIVFLVSIQVPLFYYW